MKRKNIEERGSKNEKNEMYKNTGLNKEAKTKRKEYKRMRNKE